ncbi:hypothetical protein EWB00_000095 [Schistosoma japonicum]|uniref:Uncharacterized protein n=2 Tax=Schistosoma japonicum TaxID=6182 RepID=A0A4Z2DK79_SCHJA|nr:Nucleolar protein 14 [Schistosoma japonicum]TNN16889.1 hypothetical protein EWB00_000095 [Schistosoma japonicum]
MTKNSAKRHVCVKKSLHRIDISHFKSLRKDLERYGKVGGLFDKRLSNRNFVQSESEVFLKRHIVEKLRQLDKVLLENIANDDPLFKAAFSNSSPTQLCTAYDVEGGIEGHIVDKVFFTNGPMTSKPVNNIRNFLLDKIAVEKLEKLKRVEENVEQRERLKIVDDEWSKTIRFLLTKVHNMKKRTKALTRQNHDGNVSRLLEELNADKKISPIDFDPTSGNSHNQFFRLQDMVSTLRPIVMANDHLVEKKTPISYLRILLRLPKEKFAAIAFISDQLRTARLRCLEDVIRYLFITQIAFEYCSESCKCLHNDTILYRNYIFCPEIVHALSRMFHLTSIGPNLQKNILVLRKSCINVEALCVNHDLNTKRILLRTVTKEKRCAMRNFRRDSQFLASHRLNIIKKSDYIREKKTKAILSSIRSLED